MSTLHLQFEALLSSPLSSTILDRPLNPELAPVFKDLASQISTILDELCENWFLKPAASIGAQNFISENLAQIKIWDHVIQDLTRTLPAKYARLFDNLTQQLTENKKILLTKEITTCHIQALIQAYLNWFEGALFWITLVDYEKNIDYGEHK